MSELYKNTNSKVDELVIPTDLKTLLNDIADSKLGYKLSEPWKYNENALAVVVPIIKENAPERQYTTMYEVLKELDIKDTGGISQVELQNKSGLAIFVRAGTIFTGKTQNRAAQHSGVYTEEKEKIQVCCVHASHGISKGAEMKFGDVAPASITMNLMKGNQYDVWNSVRNYIGGPSGTISERNYFWSHSTSGDTHHLASSHAIGTRSSSRGLALPIRASCMEPGRTDDLLGHLKDIKEGQSVIDDMMQKVPLFDNQVGAIIFNPAGLIALETFDHPKSWAAIKKEIIEKYGDKISEKQAEHLFELVPEMIPKKFRDFIGKLDNMTEKTIRKDDFSETRSIKGEGIVGEYTLVKGQPIHVLLLKEDST